MCPPSDLRGCDFAICLDGDADRLVIVDPEHGILDGDDLLWMLSRGIPGPVVGTVMSNGGLEEALGDRLIRTGVGDAKVHAEMTRIGAALGGEPSGHIMLSGGMPTSDGLYTALRVLECAAGGPLPASGWTRWPQALRNVRNVSVDLEMKAIQEAKDAGHRVLVRASGTEPLVRVMVEGVDAADWADRIAQALPRD
jgi:phosphoglucosamine mutase